MKNQLIDESILKDNEPMNFQDLRKIFAEYNLDDIKNLNIDYNITSSTGTTLLILAAMHGRADIAKYLG